MTRKAGNMSRRRMLRRTASAAAAGGAALWSAGAASLQGQSSGIQTGTVAGHRFKAWVSRGWGPTSTNLEELRLLAISGRQLVVRTEASQLCYSCAGRVAAHTIASAMSSGVSGVMSW